MRRGRTATTSGQTRGQIVDAVSIRDRSAKVEDRAIPCHREGNFLSGSRNSHIATLVKRSSRFVMLVSPRMHRDLVDVGHEIGRHRMARLMRENQLIGRQKRRRSDCLTAPGRPGERNLCPVDCLDLRLLVVIATSISRVLRRPVESALYCLVDYQALLRMRGILISMNGRGNCSDSKRRRRLTCFQLDGLKFQGSRSSILACG